MANRIQETVKADHKTVLEEQVLKREVCTDGTPVKILEQMTKWANDHSSDNAHVFWLIGQGGSGKTTIAYTIAKRSEGVRPTSTPSWPAAFSAPDNSKEHKPRPASFLSACS
jgi:signal recognition particle GTPase